MACRSRPYRWLVGPYPLRMVMQRQSPRALVLNPLARRAMLTHRHGSFCLDTAFVLIEGHPGVRFQGKVKNVRSDSKGEQNKYRDPSSPRLRSLGSPRG